MPTGASATTPLENGLSQLQRGDYPEAIATLKTAGKSVGALSALGSAYLTVGQHGQALAVAGRLSKMRRGKGQGAVLAARVETEAGKYAAAIKRLRREIKSRPKNWEARIVLAEARLATGTSHASLAEADAIADFWQEGDVVGADALTWLARALHLTAYFQNANEIFEEALADDPHHQTAKLLYAQLFLQKENEAEAGPMVSEVLTSNPNHPLALTLAALMDENSDNDTIKARGRLEKALKVNPRFVPALQARARMFILTEQFEEAQKVLEHALTINPNDARTLSILAACRLLLEDDAGYRRFMKRALKVNKRFAEGYHIVAEFAVRQHRYADAVKIEKRALKVDPEYAPSYVGLGMGYSRVGKDKEANEALQKAFELDSYNVKAFNMTEHYYDGPVKQMEWHKAGRFRLLMHKSESKPLAGIVGDFLKEAYAVHRKNYGFTPKAPLHIELFQDRKVFGTRSTGYPGIGAHGICFGHVVTAISPSAGDFNWGMVLWHELAHVWHIQMSNSRVPRWFTEGLAEHETTLRRPEWKREMDSELHAALVGKKLKPIRSFNTMFTGAQSMAEIVLAYYYASKVVAYIDSRWGFAAFPKMLILWGKRRTTEAVFKEVLGTSLEGFDTDLMKWMETELLAGLAGGYDPGKREDAKTDVDRAFWLGIDALDKKEGAAAIAAFDDVLAGGKDGADLRLMRAQAAMLLEDDADARIHLEKALKLAPQRPEIYRALRAVLERLKDDDALYALLKAASVHEEHGLDMIFDILARAKDRGENGVLTEYAERAMHIAPLLPRTRVWRGRARLANGDAKGALSEAEAALDLPGGGSSQEARILEAEARAALGK
ncbi:MAG: tetratricopeptide (TPR) repeat protein [Myxococcota bacterium]